MLPHGRVLLSVANCCHPTMDNRVRRLCLAAVEDDLPPRWRARLRGAASVDAASVMQILDDLEEGGQHNAIAPARDRVDGLRSVPLPPHRLCLLLLVLLALLLLTFWFCNRKREKTVVPPRRQS